MTQRASEIERQREQIELPLSRLKRTSTTAKICIKVPLLSHTLTERDDDDVEKERASICAPRSSGLNRLEGVGCERRRREPFPRSSL